MKIVHICLYGPVTDGWNYQDNIIPKYQALDGNETTIIASKWIFNSKGKLELYDKSDYIYDGIRMIRLDLKIGKNINSKFKVYKNLYTTLLNISPDCIFIHNVSFIDIASIVKYAKKFNVLIYADNHCDFSNSGRNIISKYVLHRIIWRHYAQLINPYVKKFYGVLPARVDFLVNEYKIPREKTELLVMGADDDAVQFSINNKDRDIIRKKYNISKDDFLVMTGGKIDSFKTQTILLMDAISKIYNPHLKLIVFGSVEESLIESVQKFVDNERIYYIGWINASESYSYFSSCDLAVFPGRHSVFWEQVAGMGIPMLCKYWEGTTHVDCGGNVLFIYNDNVDEIIKKLNDIINDQNVYNKMKLVANSSKKYFSYRNISRRCIEEMNDEKVKTI